MADFDIHPSVPDDTSRIMPELGDAKAMHTASFEEHATVRSEAAPHVSLTGDSEYRRTMDAALTDIKQAPSGAKLIEQLRKPAEAGKKVTIEQVTPQVHPYTTPTLTERQKAKFPEVKGFDGYHKAAELAQKKPFGRTGEGSSAIVRMAANAAPKLDGEGRFKGVEQNSETSKFALGHELVHASRIVRGTFTGNRDEVGTPGTRGDDEELRAVGIGKFKDKQPSENSIRQELGAPLRTTYRTPSSGK